MKTRRKRKIWTKESIKEVFLKFYKEYGRSPRNRDCLEWMPSPASVTKIYGKWNNALVDVGLIKNRDYDDSTVKCECMRCGKKLVRLKCKIKPSGRIFCGYSCMAKWNMSHKTKSYRRSKLEMYIEKRLREEFPDLKIEFNNRIQIKSELDIFFPDLKLAFELNGIFHYEPIFSPEHLQSVQNNDERKFQACLEQGIELCVIDTSGQKKASQMEKYYLIVKEILVKKIKKVDFVDKKEPLSAFPCPCG